MSVLSIVDTFIEVQWNLAGGDLLQALEVIAQLQNFILVGLSTHECSTAESSWVI